MTHPKPRGKSTPLLIEEASAAPGARGFLPLSRTT